MNIVIVKLFYYLKGMICIDLFDIVGSNKRDGVNIS